MSYLEQESKKRFLIESIFFSHSIGKIRFRVLTLSSIVRLKRWKDISGDKRDWICIEEPQIDDNLCQTTLGSHQNKGFDYII